MFQFVLSTTNWFQLKGQCNPGLRSIKVIPNSKQNRQKIQNTEVKSILIKWVENADLNKPIANTVKEQVRFKRSQSKLFYNAVSFLKWFDLCTVCLKNIKLICINKCFLDDCVEYAYIKKCLLARNPKPFNYKYCFFFFFSISEFLILHAIN